MATRYHPAGVCSLHTQQPAKYFPTIENEVFHDAIVIVF
jgi:hypothetical protein